MRLQFLAARAATEELEAMRLDVESGTSCSLSCHGIDPAVVDLRDRTAGGADKVMVMRGLAGDIGMPTVGEVDALDEPAVGEQFEEAEDGGPPDAELVRLGVGEKICGGEVPAATADQGRQVAARPGQADPRLVERLEHLPCHGGSLPQMRLSLISTRRRDGRSSGGRGYDQRMSIIKNALLTGAVVLGVGLVVLLLSGSFSGKPSASDSFTPVAPVFTPANEFVVGRGIGKVDAPVTLEVWTDFQCPICGAWSNGSEPLLYEKYITDGRLRIEHHFFAFLGEESFTAAVGAVCAEKQNKFWAFHSYLFANQNGENQGGFSAPRLRLLAGAAGLDLTQWDSCITDPTIRADVEAESAAARAAGVSGTPTLKLGDWMHAGIPAEADLFKRIDDALKP